MFVVVDVFLTFSTINKCFCRRKSRKAKSAESKKRMRAHPQQVFDLEHETNTDGSEVTRKISRELHKNQQKMKIQT
jgi:hypothetical protein